MKTISQLSSRESFQHRRLVRNCGSASSSKKSKTHSTEYVNTNTHRSNAFKRYKNIWDNDKQPLNIDLPIDCKKVEEKKVVQFKDQ